MRITNKLIRNFLRILAALALVFEVLFSVIIPKIQMHPVYLDRNDGYIIGGAIALLISIEAIKSAIDKYVVKKSEN